MSSRIFNNNTKIRNLIDAINKLPDSNATIEEVSNFVDMNFLAADKGKIYIYNVAESGIINTLIYNEDRWDVYTEEGIFKGSVDLKQDTIQLDGTKLRSTTFYDIIDTSYITDQSFTFYSNMNAGTYPTYNSLHISDGAMLYDDTIVYDNGVWTTGNMNTTGAFKNFSLKQSIMPGVGYTTTINMPTEFYLWLLCNSSMIVKYANFNNLWNAMINFSYPSENGVTLYYQYDNRLRQIISDGICWNVYDENDLLLGSVPVGKNKTVLDGNIFDSFIFDELPDLTASINSDLSGVGGPVQGFNTISISSSGILVNDSTIYSPASGWDSYWSNRRINFSTVGDFPIASNITAQLLLWMLVNGRFNRLLTFPAIHPISVYTGTFEVSDTSDVVISFSSQPKFVPTSFVATIVGAGSKNSVNSIVAINTTTATYTRTTSGTATSEAGTNTVTYSVNQITIPNRTSDNSSRNLKLGTWRIVAW